MSPSRRRNRESRVRILNPLDGGGQYTSLENARELVRRNYGELLPDRQFRFFGSFIERRTVVPRSAFHYRESLGGQGLLVPRRCIDGVGYVNWPVHGTFPRRRFNADKLPTPSRPTERSPRGDMAAASVAGNDRPARPGAIVGVKLAAGRQTPEPRFYVKRDPNMPWSEANARPVFWS